MRENKGNTQSEQLLQMTDKQVLIHVYITQAILIFISVLLGFFLFTSWHAFTLLWEWDVREIVYFGVFGGILVIGIDLVLMKILPKHMYDDGGINDKVFSTRTIFHIFIIASIVSISEEILFRGVIQTHFGLIFASIIFALLHLRYLAKWVLFVVVVLLSFFLGYLFEVTQNLMVTIVAHFLIDFVFGCIIRYDYLKKQRGGHHDWTE